MKQEQLFTTHTSWSTRGTRDYAQLDSLHSQHRHSQHRSQICVTELCQDRDVGHAKAYVNVVQSIYAANAAQVPAAVLRSCLAGRQLAECDPLASWSGTIYQ